MTQPQSTQTDSPSLTTSSVEQPVTDHMDSIEIGVPESDDTIEPGSLSVSVNDFTAVTYTNDSVTFTDSDENTIHVLHDRVSDPDGEFAFTLSLHEEPGDEIGSAVIYHGDRSDRDVTDAISAVETQIWEWARFPVSDRYPIHQGFEALGEPDPHPPGERPGTANTWYYSFDHETRKTSSPDSMYSSYVPYTRYTFMASNDDRQWYCATLNISFNHDPPDSVDPTPGCAYGVYVYLSFTPLKPVDERINKNDTKEINRECLLHTESHEPTPYAELLSVVHDGMERLRDRAEAIGDPERNAIIEEANRRLNEETGEYEQQTNLSGF